MFTKAEGIRHLITMAASLLGMLVIIAPIAWTLVRPVLVASISEAMADDVAKSIDEEVEPLTNGFKAIVQQNINQLRREIARMEDRKRKDPEHWTTTDTDDLVNLRIALEGQQKALRALEKD